MKKIVIVCLLFASCDPRPTTNPHVVVDAFPRTENLDSCTIVQLDSVIGLLSLNRAGDYFLGQLHKNSSVFQLFDADLTPLAQVAVKGHGPNEYLNASYFGQFEGNNAWIWEMSAQRFSRVNIDGGKFEREKTYDLSELDFSLRNVFHVADNQLIGTTDELECKVVVVNPADGTHSLIDNFMPFSSPRIVDVHGLSQNMCAIKPDRSKMASAFFNLPQIDLYNTTGERYLTLFHKQILRPDDADQELEEEYYLQVCATDKYVYALRAGGKCSIQVFDWAGAPQAEFFIDAATWFCVEPDDSTLYTINFEDEQTTVRKYEIVV